VGVGEESNMVGLFHSVQYIFHKGQVMPLAAGWSGVLTREAAAEDDEMTISSFVNVDRKG